MTVLKEITLYQRPRKDTVHTGDVVKVAGEKDRVARMGDGREYPLPSQRGWTAKVARMVTDGTGRVWAYVTRPNGLSGVERVPADRLTRVRGQ